ncbi:PREDICTED: transmembrane 7 superfamily member 3-like isoform X2 [Dinoponera quadriceps]|uniref:Transmembrane 7 superfamily member 3-like isoform X2 n=1 Tax=Dinoponera quadriceps TaxID=609295 RepID=A0A6P3XSA2_DINQU|nr:PREDICTED: transmembrane 7 superfamily member 3-like isoform X2 [Dinoponera quadriceps]
MEGVREFFGGIKRDIGNDATITASLLNYRENDIFKKRLILPPSSDVTITVTDVPPKFSFIVLQIHTYQYNATLAYDKTLLGKVSKGSLFGSNIGLYMKTRNVTGPLQVFLKHDNVHDLNALIVIVPYGSEAPIPGGCNMEFEIEIAPYQKLRIENEMIIVDAQPAAAFATNGLPIPCEKSPVQHSMYRFLLPMSDFKLETYFDAIASMLTVQDIVQNGTEIPPAPTISIMRRIYSMFAGTGFVYAVVATYGNYSSAYVPTFSYGCNPLLHPNSCKVLNELFSKFVCTITLFIGIFLYFTGHESRYLTKVRLLPDCAMGAFVGYTIAVGTGDPGTAIDVLIGLIFAVLAMCISPFRRIRKFENPCFQWLSNLPLAFLCSCVAYLYAPAGMFYVLEYEWSFWCTFVSFTLAIAMLLMITPYFAEILTRAVFISYFLVIPIDYYVGTNLKYIVITIVRRITISGFRLAFVYPPIRFFDWFLIMIWIMLMLLQLLATYAQILIDTNDERQELLPARKPKVVIIFSRRPSIKNERT